MTGSDLGLPTPNGLESVYSCDCAGFRDNWPEKFCLRCLEAWTGGLPAVLEGDALAREMRRAARILAARLREDPDIARKSLNTVLEAADRA